MVGAVLRGRDSNLRVDPGSRHLSKFLCHATEAGCNIDFVIEYVAGARVAGPGELPACQRAPAKLHALFIHHGDINRYNFLIQDTTAVLIDYESAQLSRSAEELTAKAELLVLELQGESGRGGDTVPAKYIWEYMYQNEFNNPVGMIPLVPFLTQHKQHM